MNIVKILHDTAMDFYDLARINKAKGKAEIHDEYLQKAYVLEREAALKMPDNHHDSAWRYVYLRSAGWLAYQCKQYQEAQNLAHLALSGTPPTYEKGQILELLEALKDKITKPEISVNQNSLQWSGRVSSVDIEKSVIVIRKNDNSEYLTIEVPQEKVQDIARFYIGEMVKVLTTSSDNGLAVLEDIERAA